ncbi:gluconokinase [Austwickia chelonae]|uniref:Gluconokinase n=1 Tax=Austwickia chelonae NBRC 105200 TaxID=1184607 RepID=K6VPF0_9MICO|nr:gluconokinase [Austwickia chelonae]GAB78589.1 putative gluconokinase [Austwickia chelonae NBRC 105200]SEW33961.1 gluconokinase [Austwickia chelonae]
MGNDAPLVVVMGVCGSGKSTVGQELAERLAVPFADADEFHPPANIDKMAAGHALDDTDRAPWLAAIGIWLAEHHRAGAVVTCSALKHIYRDMLRAQAPGIFLVHLAGDPQVVTERVCARTDHFMPASLIDSQYATLEPLSADEHGITLDLALSVDDLVAAAHAAVQAPARS